MTMHSYSAAGTGDLTNPPEPLLVSVVATAWPARRAAQVRPALAVAE
ncbi:MAG: hypothetical protein ACRDQD_20685 [Nocardioidaceae bacterium]